MMSPLDRLLVTADAALKTLSGTAQARRPMPVESPGPADSAMAASDKRLSGALMRVNHVGEVCAQALYQAQALTAKSPTVRAQLVAAAAEETDHLAWTERRLSELGDRPSWLNPLWYAGSFALGLVAGRAGDRWSLAFVAETERQVEQHLASHLDRLPAADRKSRAVVDQMREDEAAHGRAAEAAGAARMPLPLRWAMRGAGKVMTTTAHWL